MPSPGKPEVVLISLAVALLTVSLVGWSGAGDDGGRRAQRSAGAAVTVVDFAFDPTSLSVPVGETVTWTNEDGAAHTVTSDGQGPLDSGDIAGGATFEHTFDQPGTYGYVCTIHPTMTGTVEVSGS